MNVDDTILTVLFSTVLILLLVAAVIIVVISAGRQRAKQQMNVANLRLNYEKELRAAEYEMQESTMNNISRELHDNIGQLLTFMKIQVEQRKLETEQATAILAPIDQTLDHVHQQLRLLSKNLGSDFIQQHGLLQAIHKDIMRLTALNTCAVDWQSDNHEPELDNDERIVAYRIFQELLQNIMKHAQARQVVVRLSGKDGLLLEVKDDGIGFSTDDMLQSAHGSGLRNILKRTKMVRFDCRIASEPGKGTTVTIRKTSPAQSPV